MFVLTFVLIFLGLVGLSVLLVYSLGAAIKKQAKKDIASGKEVHRFFAPVPRPGSFSFVVLEGEVVETLENVSGWKLKDTGHGKCFALDKRNAPPPVDQDSLASLLGYHILRKKLGVIWIGLYATIKVFSKWKWLEIQQISSEGDTPRYAIKAREEPVSDFLFQFTYPVIVDDAEIKDNIRVRVEAALTIWHLHPVRAFFLNKDVTSLLNAMVVGAFRSYVVERDFDAVKNIKASPTDEGADETSSFWSVLSKLNGINFVDGEPDYDGVNPLGLFGKLGMAIVRCEVVQVSGVGDTAEALEAARIAELRGNAKIAEAQKEGEARVVTARRESEALGIRQQAQAQFVMATIVKPIQEGGESVGNVLEAQVLAGTDSKLNVLVQRGASTGTTLPVEKK